MREWNGTLHVVTISESGALLWNGASWKSLSEIARKITVRPNTPTEISEQP